MFQQNGPIAQLVWQHARRIVQLAPTIKGQMTFSPMLRRGWLRRLEGSPGSTEGRVQLNRPLSAQFQGRTPASVDGCISWTGDHDPCRQERPWRLKWSWPASKSVTWLARLGHGLRAASLYVPWQTVSLAIPLSLPSFDETKQQ